MNKGYHILEIANVHGGNIDYFKKLINEVEDYKSPNFGIKFQIFKSDLIALPDFSYYSIYEELLFDFSEWQQIIDLAAKTKDVWIDVFDLYGVQAIEKFADKIHGLKFQASVLDNSEVFQALSRINLSDKYLMINVAGIALEDIQSKIDIIESFINCKEIILQIGYQSYPTAFEKSGIKKIEQLQKKFNYKIIFADHTDGADDDALIAPVFAMYAGAFGIEKHIMLTDEDTKYDFQASLTTERLKIYLENYTKYFENLDDSFINDDEAEYLRKSIQKPVAKVDLIQGKTPDINDFYFRRTDFDGLSINEIKDRLTEGYVIRKTVPQNQTLKAEDFKKPVVAAIVACRLKSTRLPEKATLKIGNISSIELCLKNTLKIKEANHVILATSDLESDSALQNYTYDQSVIFHKGDPEDVIQRYLDICDIKGIDVIIRITGDCPYISSEITSELYQSHLASSADFTCAKDFAVGTATEIVNTSALRKIKEHFKSADNSEYMSWYFMNNPEHFKLNVVDISKDLIRDYRLTLDYQEDLDIFREIQKHFDETGKEFTTQRLFAFLDENPNIAAINKDLGLTYKTDQSLIDRLNIETKIPS